MQNWMLCCGVLLCETSQVTTHVAAHEQEVGGCTHPQEDQGGGPSIPRVTHVSAYLQHATLVCFTGTIAFSPILILTHALPSRTYVSLLQYL